MENLFRRFAPGRSCVYKKFEILKLSDMHKYYAAISMYKVLKLENSPYLHQCMTLRYSTHDSQTRSRNNLIPPFPRTNSIKINYNYQLNIIWNSLPECIQNENSLRKFKTSLKNYLISFYDQRVLKCMLLTTKYMRLFNIHCLKVIFG